MRNEILNLTQKQIHGRNKYNVNLELLLNSSLSLSLNRANMFGFQDLRSFQLFYHPSYFESMLKHTDLPTMTTKNLCATSSSIMLFRGFCDKGKSQHKLQWCSQGSRVGAHWHFQRVKLKKSTIKKGHQGDLCMPYYHPSYLKIYQRFCTNLMSGPSHVRDRPLRQLSYQMALFKMQEASKKLLFTDLSLIVEIPMLRHTGQYLVLSTS